MFFAKIRVWLIVLFALLGLLLHFRFGFSAAWYLYVAALILLLTLLLFGNIWLAFNLLKKGNLSKAKALLQQVRRPELLAKPHRAYYHFTSGMIALQEQDLTQGRVHLKKALDLGLQTANDRAMICLNLAHIYYVLKDEKETRAYLEEARRAAPTDLMIKENLDKLEKALN